MSVVTSFDEAIEAAIRDGNLNREKHGAAIEAARKVASMMDESTWPMVNGKLDNVSPGVFLKYCDALGIVPKVKATDADKGKPKESGLTAFRNRSKVANG